MVFSDEFFRFLGAWQNGWGEDQCVRLRLANEFIASSQLRFSVGAQLPQK